MLVGSAPNFPDGAIDDIAGLSKLAMKYKLGLHVSSHLQPFLHFHCSAGWSGVEPRADLLPLRRTRSIAASGRSSFPSSRGLVILPTPSIFESL